MTDPNAQAYSPAPGYEPVLAPVPVAPGFPVTPPAVAHPAAAPPPPPAAVYSAPGMYYPAAPAAYPGPLAAPGAHSGYAAPQPPYGYPAVAPNAYGYARPSGRVFWALLFLCCIPYLGSVIALIVALVQRSGAKSSPVEIVRENARWAANWMISFVFYQFAAFLLVVVTGLWISGGSAGSRVFEWVIAVPLVLLLGIGIYCLVTVIIGTVRADRFVHRPALTLPFIKG